MNGGGFSAAFDKRKPRAGNTSAVGSLNGGSWDKVSPLGRSPAIGTPLDASAPAFKGGFKSVAAPAQAPSHSGTSATTAEPATLQEGGNDSASREVTSAANGVAVVAEGSS